MSCRTCGDAEACLDCLRIERGGAAGRAQLEAEVGYLRHEIGILKHAISVLQDQRESAEAECEELRVELAAELSRKAK